MKQIITLYSGGVLLLSLLMFPHCAKNDPAPQHSNLAIYEQVWNDFDKTYPYFIYKKVDWDSVDRVYRTKISEELSADELFDTIGAMLLNLRDIHVYLNSSNRIIYFSKKENYPENPVDNVNNYLKNPFLITSNVLLADVVNTNFLYLRIASFQSSPEDFAEAVNALDTLNNRDGLIIDIRSNGGGNELNGMAFAGRFVETNTLYKYTRIRNGDGWDEFTSWNQSILPATNPLDYDNKIVLLTNRGVYSSAELFVLMMKTYPQLVIVGDTTGGATANPAFRTISQYGWNYTVSRWQAADLNFQLLEDKGIAPDHYILMTEESIEANKDLIMEKAIEILSTSK